MAQLSVRFCRSKSFLSHMFHTSNFYVSYIGPQNSYWEPRNTTLGAMGPFWLLVFIFPFFLLFLFAAFICYLPPYLPLLIPSLPHLFIFCSVSGVLAFSVSLFVCFVVSFFLSLSLSPSPPPSPPSLARAASIRRDIAQKVAPHRRRAWGSAHCAPKQ